MCFSLSMDQNLSLCSTTVYFVRVRDKNLKAGEESPTSDSAGRFSSFPHCGFLNENLSQSRIAWEAQGKNVTQQKHRNPERKGSLRQDRLAGPVAGQNRRETEAGQVGDMLLSGSSGPLALGNSEGDRQKVLLVLRKLEDHSKVTVTNILNLGNSFTLLYLLQE